METDDGSEPPHTSASPLLDHTHAYPTDPALFLNKPMTPELIREILKEGPCQPGIEGHFNFPHDEDKEARAFRHAWYQRDMKNGLKSYRDWLVYSPTKNCSYCYPCWLFANRSHQHFDPDIRRSGSWILQVEESYRKVQSPRTVCNPFGGSQTTGCNK